MHLQAKPRVEIRRAVAWYLSCRSHGVDTVPFYCDPARIGSFAVTLRELKVAKDATIFRLFITLSMYQALRDVVIMRQQRSLPRTFARVIVDAEFVRRSIAKHDCSVVRSVETFESDCDVSKNGELVDCGRCPGAACHVKDATVAFNRMGDMGKLPTSAWLRFWKDGGVRDLLASVCSEEASPTKRAELLVQRFAQVHRVGRKLATMFVSALSTPGLASELAPWFPDIDGNELVVVDTNVARAVDKLRGPDAHKTYGACETWVREQAARIDLRKFRPDLPTYSPRLVQEGIYAFCSKSNRVAARDNCALRTRPCRGCAPALCPFMAGRASIARGI